MNPAHAGVAKNINSVTDESSCEEYLMLRTLYIRDYAIIDELEVEFQPGLNILTGETGAGKSIIVGALKLILGERASADVIRSGAQKAVIEGMFEGGDLPELDKFLQDHEISSQSVLILRREVTKTYSRGFINDSPATLVLMREVAAQMIDLHGQHEHQSLLRVNTHLNLLDHFGKLTDLRARYSEAYQQVEQLISESEELRSRQSTLEASRERLAYEMEEIDSVAPQEEEEDQIRGEINRLEHAEQLSSSTASLHSMLYDREDSTAEQLAIAKNELMGLAKIDARLDDARQEIEQAYISVTEIASVLQEYHANVEFNSTQLEEHRERLGQLDMLKRKYGASIAAVLSYRKQIASEYEIVANYDSALQQNAQRLNEAKETLSNLAVRLSTRRSEVVTQIESSIIKEFSGLGMEAGQLVVQVQRQVDPAGWVTSASFGPNEGPYHAFRHGIDEVEFLITANVGEAPRPLVQVASGGEISRIMLAIKRVLARNNRLPILVFDEIDVGISGAIARQVGNRMADLAQSHQIIAITHLPQIAALADAHYVVEKRVSDGRTTTQIRRLHDEESLEQVAMLITGAEVTDAMRQSARELMKFDNECSS